MKLLSHIQVFPGFLDVVYSFGEKVGPKNEGYHAFSDMVSQETHHEPCSYAGFIYGEDIHDVYSS